MAVNKSFLCLSSETVKLPADHGRGWLLESREPTPHAPRRTRSTQRDSPGEGTGAHLAQSQVLRHWIRSALLSDSDDTAFSGMWSLAWKCSVLHKSTGHQPDLHQLLWLVKWVKDFSLHSWVVRKIDAMRICIKFSYTWRDLSEIRVTWANVSFTPGILDSNPCSANHSWEGF